jgi:hypothetical protein
VEAVVWYSLLSTLYHSETVQRLSVCCVFPCVTIIGTRRFKSVKSFEKKGFNFTRIYVLLNVCKI